MKRISALILCLIVMLSFSACSSSDTNTDHKDEEVSVSSSSETVSPEPCQHVFKEEVYKEPGYGVKGINVKYCTICKESDYIEVPALPEIFELTVMDKSEHAGTEESYVNFNIEIKNTSDKKIKSISGVLSVMPADCILEVTCNFNNLSLDAYSSVLLGCKAYSFENTLDFDTVEQKVYNADFENLTFSFSPTEVIVEE